MQIHWTQILTAIIALYGAVLSTITFYSNKKEKTRQLEVKIYNGFLTYGPELSEAMLFIEIVNKGYKKAVVNVPSLVLPDRKTIIFPNPQANVQFPYSIEEGTNCQVWCEIPELVRTLNQYGYSGKIKLKASVSEQGGKKISSSGTYTLDINSWLK
ncbi:hypothetical protein [Paenibacillus chitinolyticus]|uniref:hypothetical protein n=1 Tax=Paenibacillus chitinolyticus TaxID=79263 RepID=UPI00366EA305